MKKWQLIVFKLSILLTFGVFIVLSVMSFKHGQPYANNSSQIDIDYTQGHLFINNEIVQAKIKEFFHSSNQVSSENLYLLENYLQNHPHIQKANAYIDSRGTLHVQITQINPIARVIPIGSISFYIDSLGRKIPISKIYTAQVPILSGYIPEVFNRVEPIRSQELKSLAHVIEVARKSPFWNAQITQLIMTDSGDIQMIPRLGNQIITLGDSTDIQAKLNRLDIFYQKISKQNGWNVFKYIDVQFNHQIVCK